jgi:hypothetical protein
VATRLAFEHVIRRKLPLPYNNCTAATASHAGGYEDVITD